MSGFADEPSFNSFAEESAFATAFDEEDDWGMGPDEDADRGARAPERGAVKGSGRNPPPGLG